MSESICKSGGGFRQVETELATTPNDNEEGTHVAVATTRPPVASKVAQVTDMVEKLVEALTQSPAARPTQRILM